MLLTILVITLLQCSAFSENITEIDYYVKLLADGQQKAEKYISPTDASEHKPDDTTLRSYGYYDFIIVGCGASGSALAARLTDAGQWTVLVLEAGDIEDDFASIPSNQPYLRGTKYNWAFQTVPQDSACLGLEGKRCPGERGKGFGGTTIINGLIYSRGKRQDFEDMVAAGNDLWDYNTALHYYKLQENANITGDAGYHGQGGPLEVNHHSEMSPQTKAFIEAHKELGIHEIDNNGAHSLGISRIQSNIKRGKRLTSYKAFLSHGFDTLDENLELLPNSYVIKIEFEYKKAKSVIFTRKSKQYRAFANKEIILSAGSYQTPQLLMLSGVGPKAHLRDMGIDIVKDLPVGNNLQDHPTTFAIHFDTDLTYSPKTEKEYVKEFLKGGGLHTIAANLQAIGFYSSPINEYPENPDVEMILAASPSVDDYLRVFLGMTQESFDALFGKTNGLNAFLIHMILLHPRSCGTVRLKSKNPYEYPLIDPKFFTDPEDHDIATLYSMIDLIKKLENTIAFKSMNATRRPVDLPACSKYKYDSKNYWYCIIRHLSFNIYHPVGTAKMGPETDFTAVVNQKFQVHGLESLRVVDASVLPFSFGSHPAATCMILGQRAADFINDDHVDYCDDY